MSRAILPCPTVNPEINPLLSQTLGKWYASNVNELAAFTEWLFTPWVYWSGRQKHPEVAFSFPFCGSLRLVPLLSPRMLLAFCWQAHYWAGFPDGAAVTNPSAQCRKDMSSVPGSRRSSGVGYDNPLQYSYLENPIDRGAWRATVHGVIKSRTRLSDWELNTMLCNPCPVN